MGQRTMTDAFTTGWVKQAAHYGISEKTALDLLKKANLTSDVSRLGADIMTGLIPSQYGPQDPGLGVLGLPFVGAGAGALGGSVLGALSSAKDEKGNRHRIRDGIIGGLTGGAVGGGVGALGSAAILADPNAYQIQGLKNVGKENLRELKNYFSF